MIRSRIGRYPKDTPDGYQSSSGGLCNIHRMRFGGWGLSIMSRGGFNESQGSRVNLSSVVTGTGLLDVSFRATLSLSALTIAGVAERRAYRLRCGMLLPSPWIQVCSSLTSPSAAVAYVHEASAHQLGSCLLPSPAGSYILHPHQPIVNIVTPAQHRPTLPSFSRYRPSRFPTTHSDRSRRLIRY